MKLSKEKGTKMTEMTKLRKALDNAGIKWTDKSDGGYGFYIERTHFINKKGENCSVVFGENISYGWQAGLLEVMPPLHRDDVFDDDVQGWLTAEEIIAEWV